MAWLLASFCATVHGCGSLNSHTASPTYYEYDTASRLWKIIDAKQGVTEFGYNARSQRLSVTDAKGQVYGFTYDPLGRPLTTTRGGSTLTYAYTNGVRTSRTDYNGAVTNYSYDALNRLTTISYPGGGTASYGYDALSRLSSATNINGTVSLGYDARNRVTGVTDVWGQAITYGYDASSNRTQIALPNYSLTYQYDQINRLTQLTHNLVGTASFSYDAVNRPTGRTLPNAMTVTAQYDGLDRLTRLTHARNGTTLADYQYQFNADNQITQMTEGVVTHSFGYDELQRLTSATHTTQVPEFYNYDAVGNRTASQQAALYSYQTPNRVTQIGSTTYTYDNNGNLKTKTEALALTTQYFYDHENRLTSVMLPNATVINYKYDALGRRVERNRNGTAWVHYSYDGWEVVREVKQDGSSLDYGNRLEMDDHLWQRTSAGATHYFITDHQGSTRALADGSGNVAASYSYDTFGNGFSSSLTSYGYTGREHDNETGLLYYRARWYDPAQGRFVNEDPLGLDGGINLYAYVENDPFNWVDPLGENKFRFLYGWWGDYFKYLPQAFRALAGTNFVIRNVISLSKAEKIYRLRKIAVDGCRKGYQVHHDFVQKYRERFKDLGIDIDHPAVTRWVDPKVHRRWSKELEKQWDALFDRFNKQPPKDEIIKLFKKIRDSSNGQGSTEFPSFDPPSC